MYKLINENEKARLVRVSDNQYQVVEQYGSKDFPTLNMAQDWFNLVTGVGKYDEL